MDKQCQMFLIKLNVSKGAMSWTSTQENLTVHAHTTQSEHSNTVLEYVNLFNAPEKKRLE